MVCLLSAHKITIKKNSIPLDPKIWRSENFMWLFEKRASYGWKSHRIIFTMICITFFYVKLSQSSIRISERQIFGSNATEVILIGL